MFELTPRTLRRLLPGAAAVLAALPAHAALPDTGQSSCYDSSAATDCAAATFPRQDASRQRLFSYRKLDAAGAELPDAAADWACVRDLASGLTWEVKTADGGRRDAGHRYAWARTDAAVNGGDAGGSTDTALCGDSLAGAACTSEAYVAAVNAAGLCGAGDWRLPTQRELLTLVHAGRLRPTIETAVFPHTPGATYWSADSYAPIPSQAWGVNFDYGAASAVAKTRGLHLRLVRGAPF